LACLNVDHVRPKGLKDAQGKLRYEHLIYRWDNFLLACVNCNSIKSKKDFTDDGPFLPHTHNLLFHVELGPNGVPRPRRSDKAANKAKAFLELVGLDRHPGHPRHTPADDRWADRMRVAEIAQRQLKHYASQKGVPRLGTILDLAGSNGYFDIWFSVFAEFPEVRRALVEGSTRQGLNVFPGTRRAAFAQADCEPLDR